MDHLNTGNLPPELDELGTRLRDERPVASDRQLSRVMRRTEGARGTRKSLLWRSSAPRSPRRTIALAIAALVATGGFTAAASADGLLGGLLGNLPLLGSTNSLVKSNCSAGGLVAVGAGVGSDCSGKNGANCSAAGVVAVGAGVLSDCSGGKKGAAANCSAAGLVSVGLSVLSDCSRDSGPSADAAEVEYDGVLVGNCSAVGAVAVGAGVLSDCSKP